MRIGDYVVDPCLVLGGCAKFDEGAGRTQVAIYYGESMDEAESLTHWARKDEQVGKWLSQVEECLKIKAEIIREETAAGGVDID
jgi:hypothetical protein